MRKPYPSDLTDEQWAVIEPLIPVPKVGRPREVDMREVLNAIFYLNRSGCQWDLREQVWEAEGREPSPGVGSIDSQTVKGAEVGGARGDDGGEEIRGRK